jgi:hypothetical protein
MFDRARWADADDDSAATGSFVPRWPDATAEFAPWGQSAAEDSGPAAATDISLWDAGYAAGCADVLAEQDDAAADQARLCAALERLQPMPPDALAAALADHVHALLRQLVGAATVDEVLLTARCAELAALVSDAGGATLHCHPDDLSLLASAAGNIALTGDAALPRGELRLVDGPSECATGPVTMLDQLCAGVGQARC